MATRRSLLATLLGSGVFGARLLAGEPASAQSANGAQPTAGPPSPRPAKPQDRPLDAEITSDTAAQFYEMRSPNGQTVIARRRLTTTLGVAAYDLFDKPSDPLAPSVTFRARLRYDADYGGNAEETSPNRGDLLVPGFDRGPVDLMYGYVEGRRFFNGLFGFRLGRQYITDSLGWWSFDGGLVKLTTPYYFAVELYGGLEQRGGLPFSTSRYERDGVWRGDRTNYDRDLYPSFQPNGVAPAIGAALETAGFSWLHGRLTYRRVYNTGGSNLSQFTDGLRTPARYDGTRISQERIGYSVDGTLASLGGVKAGFAYDLYVKGLANVFASIDWYASRTVTVSLDYDYYRPTFDADSIWNFFMAMPMNDLGFRTSWDPSSRLGLSAGVRGRAFMVQTAPDSGTTASTSPNSLANANQYPSSAIDPMAGATLSGRYRIGDGSIGMRGAADVHRTGDRIGFDLYGERTLETRYVLQARAGVWQWDDKLRPNQNATDVTYVLGAGYKLFPRSMVLADFQHDMNHLVGHRFRTMLWLTIAISK